MRQNAKRVRDCRMRSQRAQPSSSNHPFLRMYPALRTLDLGTLRAALPSDSSSLSLSLSLSLSRSRALTLEESERVRDVPRCLYVISSTIARRTHARKICLVLRHDLHREKLRDFSRTMPFHLPGNYLRVTVIVPRHGCDLRQRGSTHDSSRNNTR